MAVWETMSASTHWRDNGTFANGLEVEKIDDGRMGTTLEVGYSVTLSIRNQENDISGSFEGIVAKLRNSNIARERIVYIRKNFVVFHRQTDAFESHLCVVAEAR